MITWYHQAMGHQTIVTYFVHPHLKEHIEYIVKTRAAMLTLVLRSQEWAMVNCLQEKQVFYLEMKLM
jgi:hypothetical protein